MICELYLYHIQNYWYHTKCNLPYDVYSYQFVPNFKPLYFLVFLLCLWILELHLPFFLVWLCFFFCSSLFSMALFFLLFFSFFFKTQWKRSPIIHFHNQSFKGLALPEHFTLHQALTPLYHMQTIVYPVRLYLSPSNSKASVLTIWAVRSGVIWNFDFSQLI